jgi:exopolysaccharide biosynthesis polyprenyl glycosylphosphotransferase
MFRRFSVNYALFAISLDAGLVCAALAAATTLRPSLGFLSFAAHYPEFIPTPWLIYVVFALEWIGIGSLLSLYDGRKNLREVDEFIHLALTTLVATVSMAGTLYLTYRNVSRLLFLSFAGLTYLSTSAWRVTARTLTRWGALKPPGQRRVLLVGAGAISRQLYEQIGKYPQLGLKIIGFVEDPPVKEDDQKGILGAISETKAIISSQSIDDVVITLPQKAFQQINRLIEELNAMPVKVWVIPDYFRLAQHKAAIDEIAGIPMLDLRAPALSDDQRLVKRAFDLIITGSLLPFTLPIMGLIAVAIRLDSPGRVLFRQQRVGENGRIFGMYKFRTMVQNAEELRHLVERVDEEGHILHKILDDPRVTRIGRFLRKTSLDEMPQMFNVLKGEMSWVGPRPELPYLVDRYEVWQRQRFAVPQGITGWWQIHGRSERTMHLNTEDDLYYVQNYSLGLDIYILLMTLWAVLRGKGAF